MCPRARSLRRGSRMASRSGMPRVPCKRGVPLCFGARALYHYICLLGMRGGTLRVPKRTASNRHDMARAACLYSRRHSRFAKPE